MNPEGQFGGNFGVPGDEILGILGIKKTFHQKSPLRVALVLVSKTSSPLAGEDEGGGAVSKALILSPKFKLAHLAEAEVFPKQSLSLR